MVKKWLAGSGIGIALIGTALFRYTLSHLVNNHVREAGDPAFIPYMLLFENIVILSYYVGIAMMIYGINRQVTWRSFWTFDMRNFEPKTNFAYRFGFFLNRFGAFLAPYFFIFFWWWGKPFGPLVAGMCAFDTTVSIIVTLKLTQWLKYYGTRRFLKDPSSS